MEVKPNEMHGCLSEYGEKLQGCDLEGLEASEILEKMDWVLVLMLLAIFGTNQTDVPDMIEKVEKEIHEKYLNANKEGEMTDDEQQKNERA